MRGLVVPPGAGVDESLAMMAKAGVQASEDTLIVALTYRCNSACSFCIIATEIGQRLADAPPELIDAVYRYNGAARRFKRLTFSGAEVTLRPDLAALARRAVDEGGFERVRIQTNARRLADPETARRLVEAGVTELFVSLHAHTPALDAAITRSTRSFDEAARGVRNAVEAGARVLTNTVVCAANVHALADIVDYAVGLGSEEVQLWSFLEVADESQREEHVPLAVAMPRVREALDRAAALGVPSLVKWFPRCLLGPHGAALDNHQPQMLIRDEFQTRLASQFGFDCVHRGCRWLGRGCDGLHETYRARFGDEAALLRPDLG